MLKKELNRLRKYFIPKKFNPLGSYTERQLTHATAYRMLVHAEEEVKGNREQGTGNREQGQKSVIF